MTTIAMPAKTSVAHRLLRLARLFETGQASPLMEQTLNGLRYLRVGGRGEYLGAEKTRSQKNT